MCEQVRIQLILNRLSANINMYEMRFRLIVPLNLNGHTIDRNYSSTDASEDGGVITNYDKLVINNCMITDGNISHRYHILKERKTGNEGKIRRP